VADTCTRSRRSTFRPPTCRRRAGPHPAEALRWWVAGPLGRRGTPAPARSRPPHRGRGDGPRFSTARTAPCLADRPRSPLARPCAPGSCSRHTSGPATILQPPQVSVAPVAVPDIENRHPLARSRARHPWSSARVRRSRIRGSDRCCWLPTARQPSKARETMQALIPPMPIDSLPPRPDGTSTAWSNTKRVCVRAIDSLSASRTRGVGKSRPRA